MMQHCLLISQPFPAWRGVGSQTWVHCHQLDSELLRALIEYSWRDQEVLGLKALCVQPSQLLHQSSELFFDLACF